MAFAVGYFMDNVGRNPVEAGFVLVIFSVVITTKELYDGLGFNLLVRDRMVGIVNVPLQAQGPVFLFTEEASSDRLPFAMNLGDFIFGMGMIVMPIVVTL